jgi:Family of unknown function (DUF6476)
MTTPDIADEELSPAQARIVARMRILMLISAATTMLGIAVVIGVIGYRVFRGDGRLGPAEATALLPKGAHIVATAVAGDLIIVTVNIGDAVEIRTFDARTLRPQGRLQFGAEP